MENRSFKAMASQLSIRSIIDKVRSHQAASRYKVLQIRSITYRWARI
jgi:hypothetical protein